MMKRRVLVTGASAGIGEAFAEVFAAEGYDLVLTARREDRLAAVARRLEQRFGVGVETLTYDLGRPDAVRELCDALGTRGLTIDALVNNAGYGIPGTYLRTSWDAHATFLNVMVVAVTELTHRLLPGMIERRFGRIINVASLAGLVPAAAGHTLYAASKAFLIKFSESLALEVRPHGVHVTALCPGFTWSEFHDVNGMRAKVSRLPSFLWMDADIVARQGYEAVDAGKWIVVPGRVNGAIALLSRLCPPQLVRAVGRRTAKSYRDTSS